MGRNITCISFSFTTHCNMSCPDCCAGITSLKKKDRTFYDWEYYENAAKYFYGIDRINLTGGEPSVHPKFEEFVPKLKELFGCKNLTVWTNGTMFKKKPVVWKYFDQIHITNYTAETFEGSPDNTKEIEFIRELLQGTKTEIFSTTTVHLTPKTKKGDKMCFRGYSDTVEFVDGFIYPCCAGSGLKTKIRLALTENWKEEILKLHPPCHECVFGES